MKKKTKIDKKIEKNGPILHFKRIIKISKTLWLRFQMFAFLCGIDQNLLLQETKLQLKKIGPNGRKTAKNSSICANLSKTLFKVKKSFTERSA